MILNKRNIFLIDGIGALLSALSLGVLLPMFQGHIGMPRYILYSLAICAAAFSIYSLSCFLLKKSTAWLAAILLANATYCLLTAGLVIYYSSRMKPLGYAYFVGEIAVIAVLVWLEFRIQKSE